MIRALDSLAEVAGGFDAIVLDQWGVLHDGTAPYPGAVAAVAALRDSGTRLAVLSNSGKRAAANADRIAAIGFDADHFDVVMTSGEALWRDIEAGRVPQVRLCPIARASGDAEAWVEGLDIALTDDPEAADAILLMGLPDGADPAEARGILARAMTRCLPVLCTNPDRASPRAGGAIVASPGALAHAHEGLGGDVEFYGKPYAPVFRAVEAALGVSSARLLMVGDSLEHDIAGAAGVGWATAFVRGGLHAAEFACGDPLQTVARLAREAGCPPPTFTLHQLQ